jgi:hypothetical protein
MFLSPFSNAFQPGDGDIWSRRKGDFMSDWKDSDWFEEWLRLARNEEGS